MMRISLALLTILCFTFSLYAQQTTNLEIDKSAAQIHLGKDGDAGPHGLQFDDPEGNLLNLFYRSSPNKLIVEDATSKNLFSIGHGTEYGYFSGNVGFGVFEPEEKLHIQNGKILKGSQ